MTFSGNWIETVFAPVIGMLLAFGVLGFFAGRRRALRCVAGDLRLLRSPPGAYGMYVAFWCCVPGFLLCLALWISAPLGFEGVDATQPLVRGLLLAAVGFLSLAASAFALWKIEPRFPARVTVERYLGIFLAGCSCIAVLTTVGIVLSLVFESWRFFREVPISDFLFGLKWSPQTALRTDQVASSGAFGAIPVFVGTLLITGIAICVAAPIGLMAAIYLVFYAKPRSRSVLKPVLEILAGIPTIVYGFFAAIVVAPALRSLGVTLGLDVASESALAAGLVMGVMIIPFVSSLSDDALHAVPRNLFDGSLGLGATLSETIRRVMLPAAMPGIVSALLLAISRAIGETMIVVMAAGLAANLTVNPFSAVTTVTVQIVGLLTGDQEFDSAKTLAAFALGLVLFLITLGLNGLAVYVVRKYREQYD